MQSPEYVKASLASAMALRFVSGRFYREARPYCINLLLSYPEDCLANCAYCGLARSRPQGKDSFIRVDWPILKREKIIERLTQYKDGIRRVCISTVFHPRAVEDTLRIGQSLRQSVDLPLSLLITPGLFKKEHLQSLKTLGADYLGVGLDAASRRVFHLTREKNVRGPLSWKGYQDTLGEAVYVFGHGKVSCHIMVGIGETDKELAETFFYIHKLGALIHLFSFYPEPDSRMARRKRPSLKRFRRIQLLCHLIEKGLLMPHQLGFDPEGRLLKISVPQEIVEDIVNSGRPFITGGCPSKDGDIGCNRPFGSYRPGEPFRDFPFHPLTEDITRIKRETILEEILEVTLEIL